MATTDKMEKLVSMCKRRGYIFGSSEIYGGLSAVYDYGPLGTELKKNIKNFWWKWMVQTRDNIVGLDAAILMHPRVWEASGHVAGFQDPLVDCRETKNRYRADQIFVLCPKEGVDNPLMFAYREGDDELAEKKVRKIAKQDPAKYEKVLLTEIEVDKFASIVGPDVKEPGTLTEPRQFNLMFKTHVGPVEDSANVVYMRPETAQGIYVNFGNVVNSTRVRTPFGIAQIGKAFRKSDSRLQGNSHGFIEIALVLCQTLIFQRFLCLPLNSAKSFRQDFFMVRNDVPVARHGDAAPVQDVLLLRQFIFL